MSKKPRNSGDSFVRSEHGAVTIYTILVIVPIFIFQAVLIDFVRIKMAAMEAEQATRAATRSVLSAYDKQLLDYGLFGLRINTGEQKAIANHILSKYGTDGDQDDTFHWMVLNPMLEQTNIVPIYSLADHRILHQQILEDMKYKAPIEFSRNLYDKWKGKKELVTSAEEEIQQAEGLDELLEQREKVLKKAFAQAETMMNRISSIRSSYLSLVSYVIVDDETFIDTSNLQRVANQDFLFLQAQYKTMSNYVREAEQIENDMLQQWDEESNGELDDVYILGGQYYSDYVLSAVIPLSMFGAYISQLSSVGKDDSSSFSTEGFYAAFQSWYSSRSNEENKRIAGFENLNKRKEQQKKKVNDQLDEVKNAVKSQVCSNAHADLYKTLNSYYEAYLDSNYMINKQPYVSGSSLDQKAEQYKSSSISFLMNITNLMETIRDEAYVNEYALYYFNHRTSSLQANGSPLQDKLKEHALQDQEVEYILYGLSSCTANRIAAYTEIYSLRFAIRMIEALTDAKKAAAGSPLLIILIAAAEAGVKAYQDMTRIMNGEEVPVFAKWAALTMNYSDYLRMFLTVHSHDVKKLSRIQALIQLNTQINLQERPAYIQLKSVMTTNLWFIRGQQYQIHKTAEMSY